MCLSHASAECLISPTQLSFRSCRVQFSHGSTDLHLGCSHARSLHRLGRRLQGLPGCPQHRHQVPQRFLRRPLIEVLQRLQRGGGAGWGAPWTQQLGFAASPPKRALHCKRLTAEPWTWAGCSVHAGGIVQVPLRPSASWPDCKGAPTERSAPERCTTPELNPKKYGRPCFIAQLVVRFIGKALI